MDKRPLSSPFAEVPNRLLGALPPEEWERLLPALSEVTLLHGDTLCEAGAMHDLIYFPTSGVISLITVMSDGNSVEGILTGLEGAAGLNAAYGLTESPWRLTVQASGTAIAISPRDLEAVLADCPVLHRRLARYGSALQHLATQSVACNRFHTAPQRLARWLLMMMDRTGTAEATGTQEFLATMLGTHRPTVALALGSLEALGAIQRTARGRILVVDRICLESAACECYARIAAVLGRVIA